MRSLAVRERVENEIRERMRGTIDMNSTVKYARNQQEKADYQVELQKALEEAEEEEEDANDEDVELKKEFIFLIDRSYSMTYTIELAR